jgi:hypothetical protein
MTTEIVLQVESLESHLAEVAPPYFSLLSVVPRLCRVKVSA